MSSYCLKALATRPLMKRKILYTADKYIIGYPQLPATQTTTHLAGIHCPRNACQLADSL